jgi:hypothetical protein
MGCDYARLQYGVPAEIGRRVTVCGRPGIIAADRGHYIGVNLDADAPGVIKNAHPTWEVVYGEMGRVRLPTRSARRYQEYIEADCAESFGEWLRIRDRKGKPG